MQNEVLLALVLKRIKEKLEASPTPHRGPRGQRGARGSDGRDGKDFVFTEHEPVIREIIQGTVPQLEELRGPRGRDGRDGRDGKDFNASEHKEKWRELAREFALKFEDLSIEQIAALRGARGRDGRDGRDFDFEEHAPTIKEWARSFALKFDDLTAEQIGALRGPSGRDGRDGRDGKSFDLSEHEGALREWIQEASLKFADLTAEEIEKIRGPRGRDGRDGRDFDVEENRELVHELILGTIRDHSHILKLRFTDLTADDIEQLRGPRGRDGRDGKNFVFEEHREYFDSLKLKFSDLTDDEKGELKLRFDHLTTEEKSALKLRFEDLTDEEKLSLRGARGARGQRGSSGRDGVDGKDGKQGPRGLPGLPGIRGAQGLPGKAGLDGADGVDGEDAPVVVAIDIDQYKSDEFEMIFEFSDETTVRSQPVKLPKPVNNYIQAVAGGSSSSSGGGGDIGLAKNVFNLVGTFDGANTVYELPETPLSSDVVLGWLGGAYRSDYSIAGKFVTFPGDTTDQQFDTHFRYGSSTTSASVAAKVTNLLGTFDGVNTTYVLPSAPVSSDEIIASLGGVLRNDYTPTGSNIVFPGDTRDQQFDATWRTLV